MIFKQSDLILRRIDLKSQNVYIDIVLSVRNEYELLEVAYIKNDNWIVDMHDVDYITARVVEIVHPDEDD